MVNLGKSKEKLDEINRGRIYNARNGGRKIGTFEEEHKRVTLYLQNAVYEEIQSLRERGIITNLTEFVNKVLRKEMGI